MTRLSSLLRFEPPTALDEPAPPQSIPCALCGPGIAPDCAPRLCRACRSAALCRTRVYLRSLSREELEHIDDLLEGLSLFDLAGLSDLKGGERAGRE